MNILYKKIRIGFVFITLVACLVLPRLATATVYQPGATLEPDCAPGSLNCGVAVFPLALGTTTPLANTILTIEATTTDSILATLRAFAGQVANLFQVQASSGLNLFDINASGVAHFSNKVGIGTTSPANILDMYANDGTANIQITRASGNSFGTGVIGQKARGTVTSPTIVLNDDTTARWIAKGHDGVDYMSLGEIDFNVDGVPSAGSMPGRLVFSTTPSGSVNVAERMRIDSSGNVGIGTASPSARLTVRGSGVGTGNAFRITDSADVTKFTVWDDGRIFATNTLNSAADIAMGVGAHLVLDNGNAALPSLGFAGNTDTGLYRAATNTLGFSTGGISKVVIDSNGNVGVGTTSPQNKLDIYTNDGTANIQITRASANAFGTGLISQKARGTVTSPTIVLNDDTTARWIGKGHDGVDYRSAAEIDFNIDGSPASGSMPGRIAFMTTPSGSVTSLERMRIDSTGNLGIGTTSPSQKISVQGNALISGNLNVASLTVNGASVVGGSAASSTITAANFVATSTTLANSFANNVGIGTTTPLANLHIVGTVDPTDLRIESIGNVSNNISGYRSNGSVGALSAVASGNYLFNMRAFGFNGSVYNPVTSLIRVLATENYTPTSNGSAITFENTPNGTTTRSETMRIDQGGNVGIGTTSPIAKLTVTQTGPGSSFVVEDQASDPSPFTIDTSGNVLVGVANGSQIGTPKMEVRSAVNTTLNIVTSSGSASSTASELRLYGDGAANRYASLAVANESSLTVNGLVFNTANSAVPTEKMRITGAGLVGIGTTTPSQRLSVQGNALISGSLDVASLTVNGQSVIGSGSASSTITAANFVAASTTATSTFANGISINGGGLKLANLSSCHNLGTDGTGNVSCELGQYAIDVRKSADESRTSTTTLSDDTELSFPIGANETWVFRYNLLYTTGATPDIQLAVTAPAGATCDYAAGLAASTLSAGASSCGASLVITDGAISDESLPLAGAVSNGGVAGTIHLQFAQATSNATPATILRGSSLSAFRVSGGADLGEVYYTKDISLDPGTVVTLDSSLTNGVRKAEAGDEAIGVISTKPGVVIGDTDGAHDGVPVIVALAGRVPVKVSTENGAILEGDYLVQSSISGVAMKGDSSGYSIGRAISSYSGKEEGTVTVFVKNSNSALSSALLGEASANTSSTTISAIQSEAKFDPVAILAKKIIDGVQFLTNFVTARITAIRGYFDEIFAKKAHVEVLCLKKSDGGEVCVNGDQISTLLQNANIAPLSGQAGEESAATQSSAPSAPATNDTADEPAVTGNSGGDAAAPADVPEADTPAETPADSPASDSAPADPPAPPPAADPAPDAPSDAPPAP